MLQAVGGLGLLERLWTNHDGEKVLRIQLEADSYDLFGAKLGKLGKVPVEMADVAKFADVHDKPVVFSSAY
jgi:hypothetical protein